MANMQNPTHREVSFFKWWEAAHHEFLARGLPAPGMQDARAAYEVGESPATWAAYITHGRA